jgi:hypothetical protein
MPSDNFDIDNLTDARRKAIEESIHTISVEELKKLTEGLFPSADHPWRETVFRFIDENSDATFHHAVTHDRIHIIYCGAKDRGMWFRPGSAVGPLQPKGLAILKDIARRVA